MKTEQPYNPLDKLNLGESVATALLSRPVEPLPPSDSFPGAGIYAIYYTGDYPAYKPIALRNRSGSFGAPIYVGKAIPAGGRKGAVDEDGSPTFTLYRRLIQHGESIKAASRNLQIEDFACRYLVVDDIWIPLGESLLIARFAPVWNRLIDGFGNHDPGAGRYQGRRPAWDVLHPGRAWADRLQPNPVSQKQLLQMITSSLAESTT